MSASPSDYLGALRDVLTALDAGDWPASQAAATRCDQLTGELRAAHQWLDRDQLREAMELHARCVAAAATCGDALRERAQEKKQTRSALAAYAHTRRL